MAIARETERERNTKFPNKKNRQPFPEFLLAPQLWPDPSIFKLPPCEIFRHPNAGNKRNFIPVPVSCNYSQAGTINRTNNYRESANFPGKEKSPNFSPTVFQFHDSVWFPYFPEKVATPFTCIRPACYRTF